MDPMDALKKDSRLAEEWLLFYVERLRLYKIERQDIIDATCCAEIGSRCGVGNQTMAKGIQLTQLEQYKAWLDTIQIVEKTLSEQKKLFLTLRREAVYLQENGNAGRPPWVEYVQQRFAAAVDQQVCGVQQRSIHRDTFIRWWQDLIQFTVFVALKKKCLQ